MLVYSNREIIGILPALPEKWATGSIDGVLCRSGAEVSIDWDMAEKRVDVELIARRSGEFALRFPGDILKITSPTGHVTASSALGANCCRIDLDQGESATLRVTLM